MCAPAYVWDLRMDLNQLYFDHQLLLMKACQAGPGRARSGHEIGARRLARTISAWQRSSGAPAAEAWEQQAVLPGAALCAAWTARLSA